MLNRIRRGWVALPLADPYLVAAANRGVVLTCITQAKRLGLWVLDADGDRPHVGADPRSSRATTARGAVVHWSRPLVARAPGQLVDPIENVLAAIAACQPFEHALATWESAFRQQFASGGRCGLSNSGRRPAPAARGRCLLGLGLETMVVPRLRWMGLRPCSRRGSRGAVSTS